mmetsp:Transcript_46102/g.147233  ORF Transcript_46102/g.147233 Transcript_46102/m.147233 type:complete len:212 (-) Transcript_46102:1223-1858(-)
MGMFATGSASQTTRTESWTSRPQSSVKAVLPTRGEPKVQRPTRGGRCLLSLLSFRAISGAMSVARAPPMEWPQHQISLQPLLQCRSSTALMTASRRDSVACWKPWCTITPPISALSAAWCISKEAASGSRFHLRSTLTFWKLAVPLKTTTPTCHRRPFLSCRSTATRARRSRLSDSMGSHARLSAERERRRSCSSSVLGACRSASSMWPSL